MFSKYRNSTGNKLNNDVNLSFLQTFGNKPSKKKLKILTWIEIKRQEDGKEYLNTSLLKMSKIFKIKKSSVWYQLESLKKAGYLHKEARFSRNGGTCLKLTPPVIEIFKEFKIKNNSALHLPGGRLVNQEMLKELNAHAGWDVQMTPKLARHLNSAYLKKFKNMETCRLYFKNKITNAAKITCKLGFIFYLLNFSIIDSALGSVLDNQEKQVQREITEKAFDAINPIIKIEENRLLRASNLAFIDEILRNSRSGRIRFGEVESAAESHNISITEACALCGIKYEDTPDKSPENVAKRDFWRRYSKEETRSWLDSVSIKKFVKILIVEFPNNFVKDIVQTKYRDWCFALEKKYWSVKWTVRSAKKYEPPPDKTINSLK